MNTKFDAKSFNPEAFGKYMNAIENPKLNELTKSRAIVSDARLRETFKDNSQTGTVYARIPFFGTLSGKSQNYDGATKIVPMSTETFEQGVFTYGRAASWTEKDFSYDVTGGADFMANVRQQLKEYWDADDQDVILAVLKGIFSMTTGESNKKFVEKHTMDLSKNEGDAAKVNATTVNSATQKACGDKKKKFGLVITHSAVSTNLENINAIEWLKYTDSNGVQRDLGLGTWNGKLLMIDDSMPVTEVPESAEGKNDGYTTYTTYVLGEGAISREDVGAKVPYEMVRDAFKNGGEDTLITRIRKALAVYGISYEKKSQATNSPTNEELEKGTNWSLVSNGSNKTVEDKTIAIARIISRG